MTDLEFYKNTDKLINELAKGLKHISIDYYNFNEVCMELTKRIKATTEER